MHLLLRGMAYFEVGQAPALDAHVLRHDPKPLGFDLSDLAPAQRVWITHPAAAPTIEEWRKDQSVAVPVGAHQQHGAAHCVETHPTLSAEVGHAGSPAVAPGVEVECGASRFGHAMRMDHIAV